ncbi:PTS sugar transporter subunit IIA, partial [Enterococcus faecalis]|uniref:PTS sugar transporter subunit IIA n=1 Tax=Enterococcus faecalis TaxID=1351 RepID=UPI003D6A995C
MLNQSFASWEEALAASGVLLLNNQLVTPDYVKAMYQRQHKVSVYIGNFVALPHAEGQEEHVLKVGNCLFLVPDGVNFGS